ncbi:hypothetical protein ACHQM5_021182 [Ranunculus cassubicifolius]
MFPSHDSAGVGMKLVMVILSLLTCVLGKNVSEYEYLQMEYLKSLHKPAVTSIQTEHGDIYDCVDIYKQPAFDHPLLKNHTIQMTPTLYPKGIMKNNSKNGVASSGLKDGGCPRGTVPIKRAQIQDILFANSLKKLKRKANSLKGGASGGFTHSYATLKTRYGAYYGARAVMNVWQPSVQGKEAFSLSQIWVTSGPYADVNTIEVGWIVYPTLFGPQTRLFVFWTVDGYRNTGCYNLFCPGFVQVNPRIPVDVPLQVSTYNDQQYEITLEVVQDPSSGNWFLMKDELSIGYWPKSLFNYLNTKANKVDWGGETSFLKPGVDPAMGSGHFPSEGYGKAAYIREVKVIDDNILMTWKAVRDGIPLARKPRCYQVEYNPNGKGAIPDAHFLYGGPGVSCD